jgi:type VI secretion system protein ImpA
MQILLPEHVESAAIEIGRRQTFVVPVHRLATSAYAAEAPMEALCEPPVVSDRGAALLELQKIEAYYGARETTSPIPFFCERARKLTGQDFLSILKEILPENTLKSIES